MVIYFKQEIQKNAYAGGNSELTLLQFYQVGLRAYFCHFS